MVILRHSGLRAVTQAEVLESLPRRLPGGQPVVHEVDTRQFATDVERGHWGGQSEALAEAAEKILADASGAEIHYFGLAEIPHVIALGALIGDEHPAVIHDWDRDARSWRWPGKARTVNLTTTGLPGGDAIPARGSAVFRVEISFAISDDDVRAAAGIDHLAEVRIGHARGTEPAICSMRSSHDLEAVRVKIRRALSVLRRCLPRLNLLQLFVAAPPSVCFALGQELKPRNSPPIQTYRYRNVPEQPAYRPAILLRGGVGTQAAASPAPSPGEPPAPVVVTPWPRHISNAKLAKRLDIKEANHMANQLRKALSKSGQAVPPSKRGKPVIWTRGQLERALPNLPEGTLRTALEQSGLLTSA